MKSSLNLLSLQARKREQIRRARRLWLRVLAATCSTLLVAGLMQWQLCQRAASHHTAAAARYEPIRRLKADNTSLSQQIKKLSTKERIPLALAQQEPLLGLIGFVAGEFAAHRDRAYVRQIAIEYNPLAPNSNDTSALVVDLQGVTVDPSAATALAESLRQTGPFKAVRISTSKASRGTEAAQQLFSILGTR